MEKLMMHFESKQRTMGEIETTLDCKDEMSG